MNTKKFIQTNNYETIVMLDKVAYFTTGLNENHKKTIVWAYLDNGKSISLGAFEEKSFALEVMNQLIKYLNNEPYNVEEGYGISAPYFEKHQNHFLIPVETKKQRRKKKHFQKQEMIKHIDQLFENCDISDLKWALEFLKEKKEDDFFNIETCYSEKNNKNLDREINKLREESLKEYIEPWVKKTTNNYCIDPDDSRDFAIFKGELQEIDNDLEDEIACFNPARDFQLKTLEKEETNLNDKKLDQKQENNKNIADDFNKTLDPSLR